MGLVPATIPGNKSQGLVTSTHDATSSCDLLQGLVAGTNLIVCADLKGLKRLNSLPLSPLVISYLTRKIKEMTRGDKGKLFSLFVPLFTLSPYSARLCAPCNHSVLTTH